MQDRPSRSMNLVTNLGSQRVVYYFRSLSHRSFLPIMNVNQDIAKLWIRWFWMALVVDSGGLRGSV